MPQATKALPPNQNGHHASPAMNAHNTTRSTMPSSPASLATGGILAIEVSASRPSKKERARNDVTWPFTRELPMPAEEFDRDGSVPDLRHVTTLWVKSHFHPTQTDPNPPLKRGVGLRVDFRLEWPAASIPADEVFWPPRPVANNAGVYRRPGNAVPYQNVTKEIHCFTIS